MPKACDVIALTPGEPAGIGPEITLKLALRACDRPLIAIADPALLQSRAAALDLNVAIDVIDDDVDSIQALPTHSPGRLPVLPVALDVPCTTGTLDARNAGYVLRCLDRAATGCLASHFAAMVTGPVHKGVINEAGIAFTGHTEYLAEHAGQSRTVMMLATSKLRVALVTTHLPLAQVADAITDDVLAFTCNTTVQALRERFDIRDPRLMVLGLNPHAGESGHMGREEIEVIEPCLDRLRQQGLSIIGPVPADTAFTPLWLERADAVIAMYHDQGLPVLKSQGFGSAVNITLGLPFIRTSVDHGTALDIAQGGTAEADSLETAVRLASGLVGANAKTSADTLNQ